MMNKDTCLEPGLAAAAAQTLQSLDPGSSRTRLEPRCLFVGKYAQATTNNTKKQSTQQYNQKNNSTER